MDDPSSLLHEFADAVSWRAGQLRLVAAKAVDPIARSVHLVLDDTGPDVIELDATRKDSAADAPTS